MKRVSLYIFAIIGILSAGIFFYDLWKDESAAKNYSKNCLNVEVGMTLEEARKVMGDLNDSKNRSKIWFENDEDNKKLFYLSYPIRIGSSFLQ